MYKEGAFEFGLIVYMGFAILLYILYRIVAHLYYKLYFAIGHTAMIITITVVVILVLFLSIRWLMSGFGLYK